MNKPSQIFRSLSLALTLLACSAFGDPKVKTAGGRCTGLKNCKACSTCDYCKHCNSGGTCGVCPPDDFKTPVKIKKVPVKQIPKKKPVAKPNNQLPIQNKDPIKT